MLLHSKLSLSWRGIEEASADLRDNWRAVTVENTRVSGSINRLRSYADEPTPLLPAESQRHCDRRHHPAFSMRIR